MSCNCLNKTEEGKAFICTCDEFVHPFPLRIDAGLQDLPRQIAGFPEFRRAMLRSLSSKSGLAGWSAREKKDLGILLLEMWAYVCDSLSFYDKVIAQESYVSTANLRPSLRKLVGLLGYLPSPATGSFVKIAAAAEGRALINIPAGTAFRSSGFNDNPPQVFETDKQTQICSFWNKWKIVAVRPNAILKDNPSSLLLENAISIKPHSRLLLLEYDQPTHYQILRVNKTEPYTGTDGRNYSKLILQSPAQVKAGTSLSNLWLLIPDPGSLIWKMTSALVETKAVHASAVLMKHVETYGLQADYDWGNFLPADRLISEGESTVNDKPRADFIQLALHLGLPTAGNIVNEFKQMLSSNDPVVFDKRAESSPFPFMQEQFALTDKNLRGVLVKGKLNFEESKLELNLGQQWQPDLIHPVELAGNLLDATRGETVRNEILGNGDATISSQQFKLSKKPLTYLLSPAAENDRGVQSTLRVYVNGVRWKEMAGFFGARPDDEIYIVRQDDEQETYVIFGDGDRGKRVPTGIGNVIAYYRFGAGKASPPAGSITQIETPVPGLGSIINPVAAAGGDDAENSDKLRSNAPKSALLLGRAVSIQDMEVVALATPGVRTAQAEWHWHGVRQCPVIYIWYIGETGIGPYVRERISSLTEPYTPIVVEQAKPMSVSLSLQIETDPRYIEANVLSEVRLALSNTVNGLLSPEKLGIGKPLFRSRIFERVLSVAGVVCVQSIFWNGVKFSAYAQKTSSGYYPDFENGEIILNGYNK